MDPCLAEGSIPEVKKEDIAEEVVPSIIIPGASLYPQYEAVKEESEAREMEQFVSEMEEVDEIKIKEEVPSPDDIMMSLSQERPSQKEDRNEQMLEFHDTSNFGHTDARSNDYMSIPPTTQYKDVTNNKKVLLDRPGKHPAPKASKANPKKTRRSITLEMKLDIIRRRKKGEGAVFIARDLNLAQSTVSTVLKNAKQIKKAAERATTLMAKTLTKKREEIFYEMERLLTVWINDQTKRHIPLSTSLIQTKAKSIFEDLKAKGFEVKEDTDFVASKSWVDRFRNRAGIHNIKWQGETASADTTEKFEKVLKQKIEEGGYSAKQVINYDETSLYWKKLSSKTFITVEEKTAPGFKASKDYLTLVLGGNAAGDLKLKPMVIYHSETPRALKGLIKEHLPVTYKANKKAWMTTALNQQYVNSYLSPALKKYASKNNLANRFLLLLGNAPSHRLSMHDWADNIEVLFLPPNTSSIQPMEQGIIATFKAYYLRLILKQMVKALDVPSKPAVKEFWSSYNILKAIHNIDAAWKEVKEKTMNGCWGKVWKEFVFDNEEFLDVEEARMDIVKLSHQAGLKEVDEEDVINLLESHKEPLSIEELMELDREKAISNENEEKQEVLLDMPGKRPAPTSSAPKPKKSRRSITLETKLDIIKRHEKGEGTTSISRALNLVQSSVSTVLKNAEQIKKAAEGATTLMAKTLTRRREGIFYEMERLLTMWINDQTKRHIPLSTSLIQTKAKSLFEDLKAKGFEVKEDTDFVASNGWLDRFRNRAGLCNMKLQGEAASADTVAIEKFNKVLVKKIEEGGYSARQVINYDATGLYWKKLSSKTYISIEEKTAPGFKASKDHLTLVLGGNAAGDLKLKPMMIYHSENPRALKGLIKEYLPIIFKANKKAWMTTALHQQYLNSYLSPALKEYALKNNLANRFLLLVDHALSHPLPLHDWSDNIEVLFLPPNTTSLMQPMDQGIIATFKAYYQRLTLKQMVKALDAPNKPAVKEFWSSYNILKAIHNVDVAWKEVKEKTMNGCWGKIWKECVYDSEGFLDVEKARVDIVNLSHQAGFEDVDEADVINLLESHREPLSTEDLMELDGEKEVRLLEAEDFQAAFKLIDEGLQIFKDKDPNPARSEAVCKNVLKDLKIYQKLYEGKQRRAKQLCITSFFTALPE